MIRRIDARFYGTYPQVPMFSELERARQEARRMRVEDRKKAKEEKSKNA